MSNIFIKKKINPKNRYDCISPYSSYSYNSPIYKYSRFTQWHDRRIPYKINIINLTLNLKTHIHRKNNLTNKKKY